MEFEYKRKNYYKEASEEELKKIFDYAEDYKQFLFNSKTERGAVKSAKTLAEAKGYKNYKFGDKVKAGDKLYFINRDRISSLSGSEHATWRSTVLKLWRLTLTAPVLI